MGEFDGLDDELFSERLDFRPAHGSDGQLLGSAGAALAEPATVRLEERAPARVPNHDPAGYGPYAPYLAGSEPYAPYPAAPPNGPYAPVGGEVALRSDLDASEERDPILVVALAGLLVLVLISTGVVLWWFA